jgi:hypothetical protein
MQGELSNSATAGCWCRRWAAQGMHESWLRSPMMCRLPPNPRPTRFGEVSFLKSPCEIHRLLFSMAPEEGLAPFSISKFAVFLRNP